MDTVVDTVPVLFLLHSVGVTAVSPKIYLLIV